MSYPDVATSGHRLGWHSWDRRHKEQVEIRWENRGWVVEGMVGRERVHYVLRLNASWRVSQFLLFRDLDEPDLWLGTDGSGRWGEINGAHRPDLDGCLDIELSCTPMTTSLPIRRLPLADGQSADLVVACVDVDTLQIRRGRRRYARIAADRWTCTDLELGSTVEVPVDDFGLVGDVAGRFRRSAAESGSPV